MFNALLLLDLCLTKSILVLEDNIQQIQIMFQIYIVST